MTSMLDYFLLFVSLLTIVTGLIRGFIKEIFSLVYLVFLIFLFPKIAARLSIFSNRFQSYPVYLLSVFIACFAIFFLIEFAVSRFLKDSKGTFSDRIAGGMLGFIKVCGLFFLLAIFSEMNMPPLTMLDNSKIIHSFKESTGRGINYSAYQDKLFDLMQNNMEKLVTSSLRSTGEAVSAETDQLSQTAEVRKIKTIEDLQSSFHGSAKLNELFSDPEVQEKVQKKDIQGLLSAKKFKELSEDQEFCNELKELMKNTDLKSLMRDMQRIQKENEPK
ncbi:MAG: CvpA family protein [Candidatus Wallbacteria bacterium]|nr:CvpA family protein [Candidatus Wallbacteria bacterium]